MKNSTLFIFLALIFLTCSCVDQRSVSQEQYMVDILNMDDRVIGKGVYLDDRTILTNAHILSYLAGQKVKTSAKNRESHNQEIDSTRLVMGKDLIYLYMKNRQPDILTHSLSFVNTDDPIYVLVNRSGSLVKIEGKVLDNNVKYIGYDATLSENIFTGAIESDIVLLPGESGTPVWKKSGELIGIMSAVDQANKKSYIVY